MEPLVHVVLYLSAFLPMLIVMWLKEVLIITIKVYSKWQTCGQLEWKNFLNLFLIIELCIIIIVAFCLFLLIHSNRGMSTKTIIVRQAKNKTAEYFLNYYSLFVLSLIGFSLIKIIDVISLCLLLIVLGIVYVRNGMYYLNPMVNILKRFIYEIEYIEYEKTFSKIIIAKEKIYDGDDITVYMSKYDFSLVKEKV